MSRDSDPSIFAPIRVQYKRANKELLFITNKVIILITATDGENGNFSAWLYTNFDHTTQLPQPMHLYKNQDSIIVLNRGACLTNHSYLRGQFSSSVLSAQSWTPSHLRSLVKHLNPSHSNEPAAQPAQCSKLWNPSLVTTHLGGKVFGRLDGYRISVLIPHQAKIWKAW